MTAFQRSMFLCVVLPSMLAALVWCGCVEVRQGLPEHQTQCNGSICLQFNRGQSLREAIESLNQNEALDLSILYGPSVASPSTGVVVMVSDEVSGNVLSGDYSLSISSEPSIDVGRILNYLAELYNCYVLESEWGFMFLKAGHVERLDCLVLSGRAVFAPSGDPVTSLELCQPSFSDGTAADEDRQIWLSLDGSGEFLCVLRVARTIRRFLAGRWYEYSDEPLLHGCEFLEWRVDGTSRVRTPVSNLVVNAVNQIDIVVPFPAPPRPGRTGGGP